MATSQAAVLVAPRQIEMQEFNLPEIGDDDGLLKIGSHRRLRGRLGPLPWRHQDPAPRPWCWATKSWAASSASGPRPPPAGASRKATASAWRSTSPAVTANTASPGHYNVCGKRWYGHLSANENPGIWGGYSQYLYLDPKAVVYPMSDKVPVEIAQLFLSMGNGVRWVQSAGGANIGSVVAILGPGHVGMGAVVAAKEAGADCVIVTGLAADASRLAVCPRFGG